MTSIMRKRLLVVVTVVVMVALLVVTMQAAFAAAQTFTTIAGKTDGTWPYGSAFGNVPVGTPNDSYHMSPNHWNPESNGSMAMQFDDALMPMAFQITGWTDVAAGTSLDWASSASVVNLNGTTWEWSPTNTNHAPAAYPDAFSGCHWGQCTFDSSNDGYYNAGVPYPIQASKIKNLNSTFIIDVTGDAAGTGSVWNAAFDIWLDKGDRVIESGWTNQYPPAGTPAQPYEPYVGQLIMPGFPGALAQYVVDDQRGQPNGAEVMIWMNNRGYNNNPITPAGVLLTDSAGAPLRVSIAGGTWEIWAARLGATGNPNWNVISYVKVNTNGTNPDTRSMANFDANVFIADAMTRDCPVSSQPPNSPPTVGNKCASPDWWLTSVQAGFEIWAKGNGLKLNSFSVKPNTDVNVDTGRTDAAGKPFIFWGQRFVIRYKDTCGATAVGYTIHDNLADTGDVTGSLVEVVPGVETGVDLWAANVLPIFPNHEDATITFTPVGCGTPLVIPVFVDPSGVVVDTLGRLVQGADVTLNYAPGVASIAPEPAAASFVAVPDQNAGLPTPIMCPPGDPSGCYGNIDNPDQTDVNGFYRWDVADGWYKVQASKSGCMSAESVALPVSEGNPATNVNLVLDCGGVIPPDDLSVVMTPMSDWNTGYCRNVIVTNNGSAPVDWKVTFTLVDGGTINNFWNVVWSQSGNQVTIEGVSWNNILQPGQGSHSLGFCATK